MLSLRSLVSLAAILIASSWTNVAEAQADNASCLPLTGSTMCPSFVNSTISPSALAPAYSFFSDVSDVASFDRLFRRYFTDYQQFRQTKLHTGLQCNETGSLNATLQWAQTVLCGQFTSYSYNAGCTQPNSPNASTPLVCQNTCTEYANSEVAFVSNASYCTPTSRLRPASLVDLRNTTLRNDHDGCTSWTAMYSTNNATCVEGISNEPNCGWGSGANDQLCSYCSAGSGSLPTCCYDQKTDLSGCAAMGYPAAALVRPTTSIGPGFAQQTGDASSSSANSNGGNGHRLSGGQLAGIIVGCILGALLIGALLAWLLFLCCCGGRRKRQHETEAQSDRQGMLGGAASAATTSPREKAYNLSEDTNRNPSMSNEKSHMNMGMGAGAGLAGGALAGGAAAAAGNRGSHNDGSANSRPLSTATTGTDGRGTTVPSVRCQYTGQEITPGDTVVAIYPYSAGLSDELDLTPETREELHVVRIYDDGWCLLRRDNGHGGKEGAAPLVCCQSSKGELPAHMRMGDSTGTGTGSGTTDDEAGGMTSGAEGGMTSSVGGAVTADEHGFTSDAASR